MSKKRNIFDKFKKFGSESYDFFKDSADDAYSFSSNYISQTSKNVKTKFFDDFNLVKEECYLLNRLKSEKIPITIKQATLLGVAGAGISFAESDLAGISRRIMDNDDAFFTNILEFVFGKDDIKVINSWMDKVPGADFSGGMFHRLEHGHDLDTLVYLMTEHNAEGVMAWFNHVWLRDFWTPHGVPYLPVGTESVYEFITNLGIKKSTAADLLTINSWEVVAALLLYKSCRNFYRYIDNSINSKRARKDWEKGIELEELGDYEVADHYFQNVLTLESGNPIADIWYSTQFLSRATEDENEYWYKHLERSYDLCSRARYKIKDDILVPFQGGVVVSLWALNSYLLCTTYASKNHDITGLRGTINTGIESCIRASDYLMNPSKFNPKSFGISKRPFSAISNDYIALNLMLNSPFDLQSKYTPLYVRNRISDILNYIIENHNEDESEYAYSLKESLDRNYPVSC